LGEPQPFVEFIFDLAIDTFELVIDQLAPGVAAGIGRLKDLLTAQGGLLHGQLDALGAELLDLAAAEITEQIAAIAPGLPVGVSLNGGKVGYGGGAPMNGAPEYRVLMTTGQYFGVYLSFNLSSPVNANISKQIVPLVALDDTSRYPFLLAVQPRIDGLRVRLDDLNPAGATFKLRLKTWISALIGEGLQQLAVSLEEARKQLRR
jgi:hypothetical protein